MGLIAVLITGKYLIAAQPSAASGSRISAMETARTQYQALQNVTQIRKRLPDCKFALSFYNLGYITINC
jgi:hypothetical protein